MRTPPLSLVATPATGPQPPATLGEPGRTLWNRIVGTHDFVGDEAGQELLAQCCAAADRAASLRSRIDGDGELLVTRTGLREHPGLKHELANRAFIVRTLHRLGLDLEPLRLAPGRPAKGF